MRPSFFRVLWVFCTDSGVRVEEEGAAEQEVEVEVEDRNLRARHEYAVSAARGVCRELLKLGPRGIAA